MRTFSIAILVIGLAQAPARSGVVMFSPEKATVDLAAGDSTLVKFDVFIYDLEDVGGAFWAYAILFGSDDVAFVSFEFDYWSPCTDYCNWVILNPGLGVYANELRAQQSFWYPISVFYPPYLLGSIVVDVAGLRPGNHQIIVDGLNDGNRSFVVGVSYNVGTLAGTASINIVPEIDIDPCGDGVLDAGEACDEGSFNSDTRPDACRTDCSPATCGDNVKDSIEQCDGADLGDCPGSCAGDCTCLPVEIPTLSAWGVAVLTLSLLAISRSGRFARP
ncbi:MAG: hypothetical protein IH989_02720 [Planctomycetes bacterium]|nr:hypothetical protein [Planctomycetota bacterium]